MLEYFLYPIVVGDMICQLKCPFGHDLAAISILISRPIFKICRQLIIIIIKILFMHHLFFFSFHFLSFVLAKNLSILPHLTFNHFFPFFLFQVRQQVIIREFFILIKVIWIFFYIYFKNEDSNF